jgi:hypothetical protein
MKKKLLQLLLITGIFVSVFFRLVVVPAAAQNSINCTGNNKFTSECIKQNLGLEEIETQGILIERNPVDLMVIIFQTVLGLAVALVVFRIVMAGMKIANAKEDPDKRNEGLKMLMNAVIGLVVAISAYGITTLVRNTFGGKAEYEKLLVQCQDLEQYASDPDIVERCNRITTTLMDIYTGPANGGNDDARRRCQAEWVRLGCDNLTPANRDQCSAIASQCSNF